MKQTHMGVEQTRMVGLSRIVPSARALSRAAYAVVPQGKMTGIFPDLTDLSREAEGYVVHPDFDKAMLAFCRGLAYFHSVDLTRRAGVVDTVTWAVTLFVLYLDARSLRFARKDNSPERPRYEMRLPCCSKAAWSSATNRPRWDGRVVCVQRQR